MRFFELIIQSMSLNKIERWLFWQLDIIFQMSLGYYLTLYCDTRHFVFNIEFFHDGQ